ncbi:MAG: PKD domain-containing protein [Planctomycetota bacterium]
MNLPSRLMAATIAAASFALPALAQSPLCTVGFIGGNGLSGDTLVFFDINVTTPVLLQSIDTNCMAAGAVNIEIYTTPGTSIGVEANPAVWTLVGTGSGTSTARNTPTNVPLNTSVLLNTGAFGVAIRSSNGHSYTNGNGTNQNFSTAELSMSLGKGTTVPGGVPFSNASLNSPRVWNGCFNYVPSNGLFANFSATPLSGASPLFVNFTDQTFTSDPNGVATWAWDFDNDGNTDSTLQNPQWIYAAPGLYSVKLTVTDSQNPSSSLTKSDYISVDPIAADFSATPTMGAAPLIVNFTDTSTGLVTSWAWDFDNDGNVDSTLQNPTWVYASSGLYTVKMTASNSGQSDSETKASLIFATGQPVDPGLPEVLQYQFNEPRGTTVANSASGSSFPAFGTARASGWHGDLGRPLFNANEPGFGELAYSATNGNSVNTNAQLALSGSYTITWWAHRDPASTTTSPFGYFFSDNSFRCFMGSAGILFGGGTGSPLSATTTFNWTGHLTQGVWNHYALVIDDANGQLMCYENGVPHPTPRAFTPNTYAYTATSATAILSVGAVPSGSSRATSHYHMDDFRFYSRALSPAEILGAMLSEQASATTFGSGCAGLSGVPTISGSGGQPKLGNAGFSVQVGNVDAGSVIATLIGVLAVDGGARPVDLSLVFGPGCQAETLPDLAAFVIGVGPSASLPLALPLDPALAGAHIYVQAAAFGAPSAMSPALDINLQN